MVDIIVTNIMFLSKETLCEVTMKLVENIKQINTNIDKLQEYITDCHANTDYEYAKSLIQRGRCFIVTKGEKGLFFSPSRFIGYEKNDLSEHILNNKKDGKQTNSVISKILSKKFPSVNLVKNHSLDKEYTSYCDDFLKCKIYKYKRKYWDLTGV